VLMRGTEWKVPPQSRRTCPATTKRKTAVRVLLGVLMKGTECNWGQC
jgi:hypothetical protein